MRKTLSLFVSLLVATSTLLVAQPAAAVTNNTVTVVASGGAAENSGWTYTNGAITPTSSVSINASDIVAKVTVAPLVINGDKILVNTNVMHATANSLTFKSTGHIIVVGGRTIQSQGGDVIFHSDSDANNAGYVIFGAVSTCTTMGNINTNGGDIIVGGGVNPLTGTSAAQNDADALTTCIASQPLAGVGIYNYSMDAGGGDISVRGGSPNLGNTSTRAVNQHASAGLTTTFRTSGAGQISFYGDGSLIIHNNAWGITTNAPMAVITETGAITFEGRGNPSGPTNARGVALGGASTFTSTSGDINLIDRTNGALAGYAGIYVGGALGATTNGDFGIQADEISQTGALTLDVDSASIGAYTTSSFTRLFSTGVINAANSNSLTLGSPGNTAAITLAAAVSSGGPISITASTVTVDVALTAAGSSVTFVTTGGVTQNAAITASSLNLAGTATYNTQSFTVTGGSTLTAPDISLSSTTETATASAAVAGYAITNAGGAAASYAISPAVENGLTFDTNTGLLSGAPTAAANALAYTITATNGAGSDTATFTIFVLAAPTPPPTPSFALSSRPVVSTSGQNLVLKGENLAEIKSIKVAGKAAAISKKASGELVIELQTVTEGYADLEIVHTGGTLIMQGFIKAIKPYAEKRTVEINAFSGDLPSKSALSALKASYLKGVPANIVTCVATVATNAPAKDVVSANKRARAACQAMAQFSSFITQVNVQVSKTGRVGSALTMEVTFDRTLTGR